MSSQHAQLAKAGKAARQLRIDTATRHMFLCHDRGTAKCASGKQMDVAWSYLKQRLKELKLTKRGGVLKSKCRCFDICKGGPSWSIPTAFGTEPAILPSWSGSSRSI